MSTDNTPTTDAEKILICRMCEQDPLGGMALSAGECVGLLRAHVAAEVARATAELREQYDGVDAQIGQLAKERDFYAKAMLEAKERAQKAELALSDHEESWWVERKGIVARAEKAEAELAELREDKARLDSGTIRLIHRDEFGDPIPTVHAGIVLRAAIDAARAKGST